MIPIAEIFGPTIQGEGPNVGKKCIFVRVAGCDFNCEWCDSKFALKVTKDMQRYSNEELIRYLYHICSTTKTRHIILTGGNPCIYDFTEVITELDKFNIKFDVETQGSMLPEWLNLIDNVVFSPKPPSSGQIDVLNKIATFIYNNPNLKYSIKIPVFNETDMNFVKQYNTLKKEIESRYGILPNIKLYISLGNKYVGDQEKISDKLLKDYKDLIEKVIKSEFDDVYVLPQLHTLVWDNEQGV